MRNLTGVKSSTGRMMMEIRETIGSRDKSEKFQHSYPLLYTSELPGRIHAYIGSVPHIDIAQENKIVA